jgi:HEAT repeat protein
MENAQDPRRIIESLVQQDPTTNQLYELSDLAGEDLNLFRETWPAVPAERRAAVTAELVEIAESDFEVSFAPIFRLGLQDSSEDVRVAAIEGLWEVEDAALVRPLLKMLDGDPSLRVREAAVVSLSRYVLLAELGKLPDSIAEILWKTLWAVIHTTDLEVDVRRRAVESLAYFDRPEVHEVIQAAYTDVEPRMRISAIYAMGRTGDQEWSDAIMSELETSEPEMRFEATRACGELQLIESTPALSLLVADPDPEVRLAAVWSLGQIGTPEARRVLDICLEEGNEAIQEAAEDALAEVEFMQEQVEFPLVDYGGDALLEGDYLDGELLDEDLLDDDLSDEGLLDERLFDEDDRV